MAQEKVANENGQEATQNGGSDHFTNGVLYKQRLVGEHTQVDSGREFFYQGWAAGLFVLALALIHFAGSGWFCLGLEEPLADGGSHCR